MSDIYIVLALAVVLSAIVIGVLLLLIRRLRQRRSQLLQELGGGSLFGPDRAYNRIQMARREVDILARQGTDVARARELVDQADAAYRARQYPRAYDLAQSAHESLVRVRSGVTPLTSTSRSDAPDSGSAPFAGPSLARATAPGPTPMAAPGGMPPGDGVPGTGALAPPRIAPHRAESQFEIRLLDSELETARAANPTAPATLAAVDFRSQAQTAFDAGNYTEALRLALKGRRGLGSRVETLALTPAAGTATSGDLAGGPLDAASTAERAASSSRCPHCGYPTTPDDAFCRGCGSSRAPTTCPRCEAPRAPADSFCGRCGERFS